MIFPHHASDAFGTRFVNVTQRCHWIVQLLVPLLIVGLAKTSLAFQDANATTARRPNIVLVVADALGVGGLSCYGNQVIETPNLDRLAASGMKFNNAYCGAPAAAPSLAMLLTGQQTGNCSIRVDTGGVPLPKGDVTIAEMLKQRGYRTGGFGKWALGIQNSEGDPLKQGFDEFYGYYHATHAQDHFAEYLIRDGQYEQLPENLLANISTKNAGLVGKHNRATGKPLIWTPERIMNEAKNFIRRNQSQPFFCYLPLTLPHGHMHVLDNDPAMQKFKDRGWSNWAIAAGNMTQQLDSQIGALRRLLTELKLEKDTIVIFCSSRGAAMRFDGELDSAGPWRGSGRSVYEGGLRVPMIVCWPGQVAENSESSLLVGLNDVFGTLQDLTQQTDLNGGSNDSRLQSFSFASELLGDTAGQERHEFLLWQWAAYNPGNAHWHPAVQAVRSVNWKLLRHSEEEPWELYDLDDDPTEASDLAAARPELVTRLEKLFKANVSPPPPQREALITWNVPFKWANRDHGRQLFASNIENVVDESASQFKGVTFEEDAILLGMSQKQDSSGTVHLNFAWQLKAGRRPVRFVHLCDTDGKIVGQLSGDKTLFSDVDRSKTVVDYIAVTPEQLESADSVAVGFYDPIRKSAVIAGGTSDQKYRLTVWEKDVGENTASR
jgi:arylsulfatase A-like enzyme